jgi:hypothetical protein
MKIDVSGQFRDSVMWYKECQFRKLALSLTSHVTLDKFLNITETYFLHKNKRFSSQVISIKYLCKAFPKSLAHTYMKQFLSAS